MIFVPMLIIRKGPQNDKMRGFSINSEEKKVSVVVN